MQRLIKRHLQNTQVLWAAAQPHLARFFVATMAVAGATKRVGTSKRKSRRLGKRFGKGRNFQLPDCSSSAHHNQLRGFYDTIHRSCRISNGRSHPMACNLISTLWTTRGQWRTLRKRKGGKGGRHPKFDPDLDDHWTLGNLDGLDIRLSSTCRAARSLTTYL